MPTIHIEVKGKVQGVFYRASARKLAEKLNLSGWIKNTEQGNVEAIVTGPEGSLQQFINWCNEGPEGAIVTAVKVTPQEDQYFNEFSIIRR
jgi:acylphosphatase